MRINIRVFDQLDEVFRRLRNGNTDREWTDAAKVRWTTLSELRRLSKLQRTTPGAKMGRSCTIDKIMSLISGLIKLRGEEAVRKEIERLIEAEKDEETRFLLKAIIIMKNADPDARKNAETMLDMVLKTLSRK